MGVDTGFFYSLFQFEGYMKGNEGKGGVKNQCVCMHVHVCVRVKAQS